MSRATTRKATSTRSVRICKCFLSLLLFPLISSSQGSPNRKTITLRFINPETGKPVSGMVVGVTAWNVDVFHSMTAEIVAGVNKKTTKAGLIVFTLPNPIPRHLGFSMDPYLNRGCSTGEFSPEEVLRSGAVAKYDSTKCGPTRVVVKAAPGEILVLDRPLSLWERMARETP